MLRPFAVGLVVCLLSLPVLAHGPEAAGRPHSQNFKDMVLAWCVADAYAEDKKAPVDAGSSVSILREWTEYDMENSIEPLMAIVGRYLSRDYSHPMIEEEMPGIKFEFLKCLDLYHSKELAVYARRYVPRPKRTYRQDHPPIDH